MSAVIAAALGIVLILGGQLGDVVQSPMVPLPESGGFDYQLGGSYEPPSGVEIVVRDATDSPDPNRYSICYINGFQTQPDAADLWLTHHADTLLRGKDGDPMIDPNWPDEYVLDPGSVAKRTEILSVIGPIILGGARDGFEAVEIDNLDTWTRFDRIAESDAIALVSLYIEQAHQVGLAIGQKNTVEIAERGATELGFDFAIAESCYIYDECAAYTAAYGNRVLAVEYIDELEISIDDLCASPDRAPRTIVRDLLLTTPQVPNYTFASCPPPCCYEATGGRRFGAGVNSRAP